MTRLLVTFNIAALIIAGALMTSFEGGDAGSVYFAAMLLAGATGLLIGARTQEPKRPDNPNKLGALRTPTNPPEPTRLVPLTRTGVKAKSEYLGGVLDQARKPESGPLRCWECGGADGKHYPSCSKAKDEQ